MTWMPAREVKQLHGAFAWSRPLCTLQVLPTTGVPVWHRKEEIEDTLVFIFMLVLIHFRVCFSQIFSSAALCL